MEWWIFLIVWFICSTIVFVVCCKENADKVEKMPVIFSLTCLTIGPILLVFGLFIGAVDWFQNKVRK